MVKLTLAFLALLCAVDASATTYYVDQTSGNDANSGMNPTAAWKNAPGMSAYSGTATLAPGDIVYFDRGDTWLVGGTQGLYLVGGVTYIGDTWGSGTRATIRSSSANDAGVVRFRDHATLATVLQGFDVDANHTVSSGVDINHRFSSTMTGAIKRVKNVIVHNVSSSVTAGQYKYGIIASSFNGDKTANVEILNSIVHDVSRDAICLYPGDNNGTNTLSNVTVRGNEVYNTGQDPDYCCGAGILIKGHVQDAFVEYNWVHDVKGASIFMNANETVHYAGVGLTNVHVRYNIVTNSTANGALRIYNGPSGGDPQDVKIYGNIVYNSSTNGGLLIGTDLKNSLKLLVYNNVFFNAPVIISSNAATVSVFEFRNNIVYYLAGTPLTDVDGKITSHSNNVFYRGSGTLVSSRSVSYTASNLGSYEATALSVSPLFKDTTYLPTGFSGAFGVNLAPNRDGLSLQPGSPAIDHGASLSSSYSGSINGLTRPVGNGWDIGSYESGGVVAVPSAPTNVRILPEDQE